MAFIGPAAWLLGMLALAFRPDVGRSRASFGLAVGALLATLLRVAADTGTAAVPLLPDTAERSGFSSYMIGQLVWVAAALVGLLGYGLSRLARKLPGSPVTRASELSAESRRAADLRATSSRLRLPTGPESPAGIRLPASAY